MFIAITWNIWLKIGVHFSMCMVLASPQCCGKRFLVLYVIVYRHWGGGGGGWGVGSREKNVPTIATRIVVHNTASKLSVAIFTFGLRTINHGEAKIRTNSAAFM